MANVWESGSNRTSLQRNRSNTTSRRLDVHSSPSVRLGPFKAPLTLSLQAASFSFMYYLYYVLYGCEAWFLSSHLITKLDQFQAEIGRCILGLSRFHTREAVLIGLRWPSLRCLVPHRKLAFLARLLSSTQYSHPPHPSCS